MVVMIYFETLRDVKKANALRGSVIADGGVAGDKI